MTMSDEQELLKILEVVPVDQAVYRLRGVCQDLEATPENEPLGLRRDRDVQVMVRVLEMPT